MIDLVGGHIQLMFGAVSTTLPHVRSAKLRVIAVSSPARWPSVPNVPTVSESGLAGFEAATWYGLLAPSGTPQPVVARLLHAPIRGPVLHQPEIKSFGMEQGFQTIGNKPDEFAEIIRRDMQKWGKLMRSLPSASGT